VFPQVTQKLSVQTFITHHALLGALHILENCCSQPSQQKVEGWDRIGAAGSRATLLFSIALNESATCPPTAERSCRQESHGQLVLEALTAKPEGREGEELCASAASMANSLGARAIFVYTRRGYMANFLSRCRPDCPVFAFTGLLHPPENLSCPHSQSLSGYVFVLQINFCASDAK